MTWDLNIGIWSLSEAVDKTMSEEAEKRGKTNGIGLFGGTFNPVHLGHLRGAEDIREAFGLKKIIFIPAANPPHKTREGLVDAGHRLQMVKLATSGNPYFSVSDVELKRAGKSYSIDTIRYFRERKQGDLFFILGGDAFMEIETWKEFRRLFSLCHYVVMTRPRQQPMAGAPRLPASLSRDFRLSPETGEWIHLSGYKVSFKEIDYLDISSTKIRNLVRKRKSIRYLTLPDVEAYIHGHGLYRRG
jgi:nicotinate-nucleotide adenylyltransferase